MKLEPPRLVSSRKEKKGQKRNVSREVSCTNANYVEYFLKMKKARHSGLHLESLFYGRHSPS
jgi:hypothetical protein